MVLNVDSAFNCEQRVTTQVLSPGDTYRAGWHDLRPGSRKFVHQWGKLENSWASVCIIHGLGEHGGRYHRLAKDLSRAGLWVNAFDQQGHGKSAERRGCIESYDSMLDDVSDFIDWCQAQSDRPLVLFGHSMGGNISLNYALRRDNLPDGVISSSPMIRAASPPSWLLETVARLGLRYFPNFRLQSRVVAERLMNDPKEQSLLIRDELFHSKLSLRLAAALLDSGEWTIENAQRLNVKLLLTHGTEDLKTCHKASIEFAEKSNEYCQLEILQDRLHDPFRDTERDAVIQKFIGFMQEISAKAIA